MSHDFSQSKLTRVLLIEADEYDFEITRDLLWSDSGEDEYQFDVTWAESLDSGVEYLKTNHVEAVLLDLALPDSDGLDTYLRISVVVPGTPIVVLTSLEYEGLGIEAVRRGAQDCLIKGEVDGRSLGSSVLYAIERKVIDNSLRLQYATTCILSEPGTFDRAADRILEEVCQLMRWDCGVIWNLNQDRTALRCGYFWTRPGHPMREFEKITRESSFTPGKGLPGRAWTTGSVSVVEVLQTQEFPRLKVAGEVGLRAALALPIMSHGTALGVMEFFSLDERPCHKDMLQVLCLLGTQIGQSIQQKQAEKELANQEKILQSVLDSVAEGVIVADAQGKFLFFNPAVERLIGLGLLDSPPEQRAELYGLYKTDQMTLYTHEELPLFRAIHGESVDGEQMYIRNAQRPNGVWIDINARPVINEVGQPVGGVVVFRDITENKRLGEFRNKINDIVSSNEQTPLIDQLRDYALLLVNNEQEFPIPFSRDYRNKV